MDNTLVSCWFNLSSTVPLNYVQSPESRPGTVPVAVGKTIPVVDLGGHDHAQTLMNILRASEEYGFFQVINHGVSKELIDDTLNIFKEFHAMPAEEKISESSRDPNGTSCRLYTSREINNKDCIQYWRDTLRHLCPPSGEFREFWPQKPARYREVVEEYTQELRALGLRILEMLCEGLGLDPKYCSGLSENPLFLTHHYPPCPEPSLTLGTPKHRDPNLFTILLQEKDVNGLQVFKDGEWIVVEPMPYAFVVNIGLLLQIISNGRLIGAEHRSVTNSTTARTTIVYFIRPKNEETIEPAKPLISNSGAVPIYRSITYEEILKFYMIKGPEIEPELLL